MRRLAFALAAALPLWPGAAMALMTGNDLWEPCQQATGNGSLCLAYVAGIAEALELEGKICLSHRNVTYDQVTDIVVKYLRDHPEERHYDAARLFGSVLKNTFPCKWGEQPLYK